MVHIATWHASKTIEIVPNNKKNEVTVKTETDQSVTVTDSVVLF